MTFIANTFFDGDDRDLSCPRPSMQEIDGHETSEPQVPIRNAFRSANLGRYGPSIAHSRIRRAIQTFAQLLSRLEARCISRRK